MPLGPVRPRDLDLHHAFGQPLGARQRRDASLMLFEIPACGYGVVFLPIGECGVLQHLLAKGLGAPTPGRSQGFIRGVPFAQPRVELATEDVGVVRRERPQGLVGVPHEEAILVGDLDERHGRVGGVTDFSIRVYVREDVAGVLLLGVDQSRGEDAVNLVEFTVCRRQAQDLAVLMAHVQVDVDENPALGQLVDEEVQSVEGLGFEGPPISAPDASGPAGGVHVVEPNGVDAGCSQASCHLGGVLVGGEVCAEAQVYSPDADLSASIKVSFVDFEPLGIDRNGPVLTLPDRLPPIDLQWNDERHEVLA